MHPRDARVMLSGVRGSRVMLSGVRDAFAARVAAGCAAVAVTVRAGCAVLAVIVAAGCAGAPAADEAARSAVPAPVGAPSARVTPDDAAGVALADAPAAAPVDAPAAVPVDAPSAAVATIVDWPIAWSDERERLMLAYRRAHTDPAATDLAIEPRVVVLHYTGGDSAKATHRYFDRTRLEASRAALRKGGAVNVSAHFLVDRDGTIYRLQPETRMARHCIGLNHVAIGIENVGDGDRVPLTDAQAAANAALIRDLAARFPLTHVIGHSESNAMRGHAYFVERVRGYRNSKPDPGDAFLRDVRARIADLGLAGAP